MLGLIIVPRDELEGRGGHQILDRRPPIIRQASQSVQELCMEFKDCLDCLPSQRLPVLADDDALVGVSVSQPCTTDIPRTYRARLHCQPTGANLNQLLNSIYTGSSPTLVEQIHPPQCANKLQAGYPLLFALERWLGYRLEAQCRSISSRGRARLS